MKGFRILPAIALAFVIASNVDGLTAETSPDPGCEGLSLAQCWENQLRDRVWNNKHPRPDPRDGGPRDGEVPTRELRDFIEGLDFQGGGCGGNSDPRVLYQVC
jgi:hypothetical protein